MDDVEARDIIIGALLSDASVTKPCVRYRYRRRKAITARGEVLSKKCVKRILYKPIFSLAQSGVAHTDWLIAVRRALLDIGIVVSDSCPKVYHRKSNEYNGNLCFITIRSAHHPILAQLREEWYPSGYKEVPWEFRFSDVSLANMFMGDGSSSFYKDGGVDVKLATQGFSEVSVCRIEHALHLIGIEDTGRSHYHYVKSGSGFAVSIKRSSQGHFMNLIEPHVVPSFMYKIKRR